MLTHVDEYLLYLRFDFCLIAFRVNVITVLRDQDRDIAFDDVCQVLRLFAALFELDVLFPELLLLFLCPPPNAIVCIGPSISSFNRAASQALVTTATVLIGFLAVINSSHQKSLFCIKDLTR